MTDRILIEGLEFYAFHGASDAEQTVGHRYRATVRLGVDTRPAGRSDALNETVSYADVARTIVDIATTTQFRLLEALCAKIIDILFAQYPLVQTITLRVEKIAPPMNNIVASVGVEIHRERNAAV